MGLATEMYMIQVDGMGIWRWERLHFTGAIAPTAGSAGYCVQQTLDGGYILSGEITPSSSTGTAVYLVKTNASGDTLTGWTKIFRYASGNGARSVGASVAQAIDGSGYFVCGHTYTPMLGQNSVLVLKTNIMGDTLWRYQLVSAFGTGVRATTDGGCIASAYRMSGMATLIKLTPVGTLNWGNDYGSGFERAYDVAPTTPDGGYIFTGFTRGSGSLLNDIYLVKTDKNGLVVK
jgi:hypothetical protein